MESILKIKNIEVAFQTEQEEVTTLKDVNFTLNKGEIIGLVGESGSGKSITSLSVMGLVPISGIIKKGEILFKEQNLLQLSEKEMRQIRGNKISMIFQEPMTSLNPVHTIGRQIDEVLFLHQKISKKGARIRTIELLNQVGIPRSESIVHEYPHNLSGGMRQRVMIAMAIACEPEIIIADEPTTALDVTIQAQILDLLIELQQKKNISILFITHDLGVVAEVCQRVIVMYAGQIVEKANVIDIFTKPRHPYTLGLINSIPSLTEERDVLETIPGQVPSPHEFGKGCRFASRCFNAGQKCFTEEPLLERDDKNDSHSFRCWYPLKEEQHDEANIRS